MFYGIAGPSGRLLPYSYRGRIPKVSKVCRRKRFRGPSFPVSGAPVWSLLIPPCIYQTHGRGNGVFPQRRDPDSAVLGRFSSYREFGQSSVKASKVFHPQPLSSGLDCKLQKIGSLSRPLQDLPGNSSGLTDPGFFPARSKTGNPNVSGVFLSLSRFGLNPKHHVAPRSLNIDHSSRQVGSGPFQKSSGISSLNMGWSTVLSTPQSISPVSREEIPGLVVRQRKFRKRSLLDFSRSYRHYYRRQSRWLGSTLSYPHPSGILVPSPVKRLLKPTGTIGSLGDSESLESPYPGKGCESLDRQQYGSRLSQQTRGHKEPSPLSHCSQNLRMGRGKYLLPVSGPSKRGRKRQGRLPESKAPSKRGMDAEPRNICSSNPKVRKTLHRSVRLRPEPPGEKFLLPQPQGSPAGSGRLLPILEEGPALRLSPLLTNPEGSEEGPGRRGFSYSNRTFLAKKSVVPYSAPTVSGGCLAPSGSGRSSPTGAHCPSSSIPTSPSRLEVERRSLKDKGLSDPVISTLLQSRKKVTSKIYNRIWITFLKFSEGKPDFDSIARILDFLQAGLDKGLKTSTLKVQISALSAFLDRKLCEHPWVKRFIQAARRIRPSPRSLIPPWDLNLVLSALSGPPFEPLEDSSIRHLTFKSAFLLAITTARRVGEIQAFSSKPPYLTVLDDQIILRLHPSFLPKVVSKFHRQQDIILPSFCSNPSSAKEEEFHSLDVRRCILKYLQVTRDFRKDDNLLVQFQGPNKGSKASKITIARWIRLAITLCYEIKKKSPPSSIKAHSTRSMATSWAELANVSIEQICRAATWATPSTFFRHYKLDVAANMDLSFGRRVLSAVVPP